MDELGQGFRVMDFADTALFVEVTMEGCICLLLDLTDGHPIVQERTTNSETGKVTVVSHALNRVLGPDHGMDPAVVSRALHWTEYSL